MEFSRVRSSVGIAGILALAVAGVSVSGNSAAAALPGSTLSFGTITDSSGIPVAGVDVFTAPEKATPTQTDRIPVVASDVTDADGHYTLELPVSFTASDYADPGTGLVTFNVFAHGAGVSSISVIETAVNFNQPAKLTRTNISAATATATTVDPESEDATGFTDSTNPEAPVSFADTTPDGDPNFNSDTMSDIITSHVVQNYGGRWTVVGQWFSNATAVQADFRYENGADSTLGVGVSTSGSFGSWHAGSTKTKSATATQGFATVSGPDYDYFRTLFTYKKLHYYDCTKFCSDLGYKAEPTDWRGGTDVVKASGPPSGITQCVPEHAGDFWERTSSTAITWTNGASLTGAIGIDLSSRTGYSSEAHLRVDFYGNRRLCGRQFPGQNPYVLMARPQ